MYTSFPESMALRVSAMPDWSLIVIEMVISKYFSPFYQVFLHLPHPPPITPSLFPYLSRWFLSSWASGALSFG